MRTFASASMARSAARHPFRVGRTGRFKLQFETQWKLGTPADWYDHFIERHWRWFSTRNPVSWERGVFDLLAMKPDCRVLELCCGGGFCSYHFFSSCDHKSLQLTTPRFRWHKRARIVWREHRYICADIRSSMPEGEFDNIVWDAGIEYFSPAEVNACLLGIRQRLGATGVLSAAGGTGLRCLATYSCWRRSRVISSSSAAMSTSLPPMDPCRSIEHGATASAHRT
jgi:SAM-dependent methyltransferase